jgi:hypothetical protein
MFSIIIVITTLNPTNIIVKSKYFPSKGSANDVEGIISEIKRKNIVCDSRMLMHNAICNVVYKKKKKKSKFYSLLLRIHYPF